MLDHPVHPWNHNFSCKSLNLKLIFITNLIWLSFRSTLVAFGKSFNTFYWSGLGDGNVSSLWSVVIIQFPHSQFPRELEPGLPSWFRMCGFTSLDVWTPFFQKHLDTNLLNGCKNFCSSHERIWHEVPFRYSWNLWRLTTDKLSVELSGEMWTHFGLSVSNELFNARSSIYGLPGTISTVNGQLSPPNLKWNITSRII